MKKIAEAFRYSTKVPKFTFPIFAEQVENRLGLYGILNMCHRCNKECKQTNVSKVTKLNFTCYQFETGKKINEKKEFQSI